MAKYDWKQLEKDYILSNYKSIKDFLENQNIKYNGNAREKTKGWTSKKVKKQEEKSNKVIEKVTEKKAEKEADKIIKVKDVANDLLKKIVQASNEINMHLARNKRKTKTVEYDYKTNKPSKEMIDEQEEIKSYIDIIDRKGLKELTSALKDLNDILNNKQNENDTTQSLAEVIQKAYEQKVGDN